MPREAPVSSSIYKSNYREMRKKAISVSGSLMVRVPEEDIIVDDNQSYLLQSSDTYGMSSEF